jgi:protein-tyrosine-phosphatase
MNARPTSVLFACSMNAVRSPMAEALAKKILGFSMFIDSAGVHSQELDPFAMSVMRELDIEISAHHTKTFDDINADSFDLIIALSHEAYAKAQEFAKTANVDIEYWPISDPTDDGNTRDQKLNAYRHVRDDIKCKILARLK